MNELIQKIKNEALRRKQATEEQTQWAPAAWKQIQEALHAFHGKGSITVSSIMGPVNHEVMISLNNQYRFRCMLTSYGITFGAKTANCDTVLKTAKEAFSMAIGLMADVVMEANIELEQDNSLAGQARLETQKLGG